ncbi:MAG: TolC family protein [Planctomycetaceae bacterium]|nr:TolC family protein [Planctomycetaceae bacterium]
MRFERKIQLIIFMATLLSGCATTSRMPRQISDSNNGDHPVLTERETETSHESAEPVVENSVTEEAENLIQLVGISYDDPPPAPAENEESITPLSTLEQIALDRNPKLVRLYHEYQSAVSRSHHIDKLPDPKIGANIFGNPIETASGSQQANLGLSQSIPWLERLNAEQQKAIFEAFAIRSEYRAARLRVLSGVRVGWYRLYVIDRQISTTKANQDLLQSLIDVANARISTGQASQGDVLLGTLELSQLEERLLTYRKQRRAVAAEINRLLARPAETPIEIPESIQVKTTPLTSPEIYQLALSHQPEIEAARLRTQATRWGIEVARLKRRPDLMFSANYLITDNNRPPSGIVNVGQDPWSVGVQMSVPLWKEKYDSIRNEAGWKHQAAQRSVQEISDRYDALILDLFTEAERAAETARLYETTILPQARQTLSADQNSYSNGAVEFDRVIRDYRSVLTLELEYQKAIGDLAIANARLEAAAGQELDFTAMR